VEKQRCKKCRKKKAPGNGADPRFTQIALFMFIGERKKGLKE